MKRLFLVAILLAGCTDAEFERIRARAELNEKIRLSCVPTVDERVVVAWYQGQLACWRMSKDFKPGKHQTPAVVATLQEIKE